jgi:hypothetical protein
MLGFCPPYSFRQPRGGFGWYSDWTARYRFRVNSTLCTEISGSESLAGSLQRLRARSRALAFIAALKVASIARSAAEPCRGSIPIWRANAMPS